MPQPDGGKSVGDVFLELTSGLPATITGTKKFQFLIGGAIISIELAKYMKKQGFSETVICKALESLSAPSVAAMNAYGAADVASLEVGKQALKPV